MSPVRFVRASILSLVFVSLLASPEARAQSTMFPDDEYHATPLPDVPHVHAQRPDAPEPPAPRFGEKGEIVVTAAGGGANSAGISYTTVSGTAATFLSGGFEAGVDYFVVQHLSIGFDLSANYSNDKGYGADGSLVATKSTSLSGGVRFGAVLPLGDTFSFYPRLTLGIESDRQSENVVSGQSASIASSAVGSPATMEVGPWLNFFAPLIVHPTPHFFFGAGPRINHDFANIGGAALGVSGQSTRLGASFVIGGFWGGDDPVAPADQPAHASDLYERRFGDAGVFVLSNETDGYALSTSYAGTGASNVSVLVAPGFDYFIIDHVSVGLDVFVGYSNAVGFDTNGAKVVSKSSEFGLAPRFGVDLPVTREVSWYPRVELGLGPVNQDETSAGAENKDSTMRLWVNLEAPLLYHVARHFFLGAGPTFYKDLSRTDRYGNSNPETVLGASVLVGGWL